MTTILIIVAILAVFLLGMGLWTRHLTKVGLQTVPQLGQIIPVAGGSIHYVEKGDLDAQTIVMIHGLAGQLQHFTYGLMDQLADEYHVIALDRPGCGYSTRDTAEIGRLPEQARLINEFLEEKGVTDAVLVGHSLGGAVSLAMALDYPDRVAALALLAPLTHKMPEPPVIFKSLEIRLEWIRSLVGNTLAVPIAKHTAPKSLQFAFDPEPVPDDFLDRAGGALGLRPSAFITASQDLVGVDQSIATQSARYHELKTPGGVFCGAQDTILSPALHGPPMTEFGLTYEEVEGLGHMTPITVPETCSDFIRRVIQATKDGADSKSEATAQTN